MIIIPPLMTPEAAEAQARYLAQAPCWVRVTWVAFHAMLVLAAIGIVGWGAIITFAD